MPLIKTTANLKLEKPEAAHNAWEQAYWRLATIVDLWLTQLAKGHHVVRGGGLTLNGANVDLAATAVAFEGQSSAHVLAAQTAITGLVAGNTYVVYLDAAGALQVSTLSAANLWSGSLPAEFVLLGLAFEVEGVWAIHTQPLLRDRAADRRLAHAFLSRPTDPPTMKVRLLAGYLHDGGSPTEVAEQESATISAPAVDPKIVRVGVSLADGAAVVIDGAEAAVPVAPDYPAGVMPACRVPLTTAHTEISEADIIDERTLTQGWVEPQVTAVIEAAGITLEKGTQDQLLKAVGYLPSLDVPGLRVPVAARGYDLRASVYGGEYFSVAGQETAPRGIAFNPPGTKMFVVGPTSNAVSAYDLGTPFDVSTAVYNGETFSVLTQEGNAGGLAFNTTGSKMFIVGILGRTVFAYDLSTPFDVSTAVYNGESFSVSGQGSETRGLAFNPPGAKMFVMMRAATTVFAYDLSTPFDVSTAVYSGEFFSVAAQDLSPTNVAFSWAGMKMFITGDTNDTVFAYDLSVPFDVSTAVYNGENLNIAAQEGFPAGVTFNASGTKMFVTGATSDRVHAFDIVRIVYFAA